MTSTKGLADLALVAFAEAVPKPEAPGHISETAAPSRVPEKGLAQAQHKGRTWLATRNCVAFPELHLLPLDMVLWLTVLDGPPAVRKARHLVMTVAAWTDFLRPSDLPQGGGSPACVKYPRFVTQRWSRCCTPAFVQLVCFAVLAL